MIQFKARCGVSPTATACLMAIAVLLAGCAREDPELKEPELACQIMKCICEKPDAEMFETPERAPVLWAENGNAYCPEGFKLRSATKKDNEFLKQHGG